MRSNESDDVSPLKRSRMQLAFFGGNTRFTMIRVGVLVVACFILFRWILLPIRVDGISMEPTYHNGRLNFVNLLAYRFHEPDRGDVVSIGELGNREMYMKRIIVKPNETYAIRDGQVFIDGQPLDEPYVIFREKWNFAPTRLGPREYLVIGDNRGMAIDAHYFGRVERRHIVGKVVF